MVFEARRARCSCSAPRRWRIEEITRDRVLVTPAPGQPGKMPFWRGDGPGRSAELGRGVGALLRRCLGPTARSRDRAAALRTRARAARRAATCCATCAIRSAAYGAVPSDRRLVIERFLDEVGDYRVCLLSPFGARVHAPLALCMSEKCAAAVRPTLAETCGPTTAWSFAFRNATSHRTSRACSRARTKWTSCSCMRCGDTPLFAAHFRECAAGPYCCRVARPQKRAPLWAQRRRSASLLSVVSRFQSFPIVLETYRECLQDVFDVPALSALLSELRAHTLRS